MKIAALLACCALLVSCSSVSTRKVISLAEFKRIYVEKRLNDNHRIDELLVEELRKLGREASSGPRTMMPADTDAVLTYQDRWTWDFHDYLIEFTVELHTVRGSKKVADGRYYQPSVTTKSPAAVIHEVLPRLFQ
jgi:hypothetical protein